MANALDFQGLNGSEFGEVSVVENESKTMQRCEGGSIFKDFLMEHGACRAR